MTNSPDISVITCTHNPRTDYLEKVISGLRAQTMSPDTWEWLIVDNASEEPMENRFDLSWHRRAKVVPEDRLGLTPARIRGVSETTGDLLVFVDDDNVLSPDFLENAARLAGEHRNLGAFGGVTHGVFEKAPPSWFTQREFDLLGVRPLESDVWGNRQGDWEISPIGAGLVVRREVTNRYCDELGKDPARLELDRKGTSLVSGGDSDLVGTALAMGMGTGRFSDLQLDHLISAGRLERPYLDRLAEGISYSGEWLSLNGGEKPASRPRWFFFGNRTLLRQATRLRRPAPLKAIDRAIARGRKQAIADWNRSHD